VYPPSILQESFAVDSVYEFQTYESVLTDDDWQFIFKIAISKTYKKGEIIIKDGEKKLEIYHVVKGNVKILKSRISKTSSPFPIRHSGDHATTSATAATTTTTTTSNISSDSGTSDNHSDGNKNGTTHKKRKSSDSSSSNSTGTTITTTTTTTTTTATSSISITPNTVTSDDRLPNIIYHSEDKKDLPYESSTTNATHTLTVPTNNSEVIIEKKERSPREEKKEKKLAKRDKMPVIDTKQLRKATAEHSSMSVSHPQLSVPQQQTQHQQHPQQQPAQVSPLNSPDVWELGEVGESEIFGELSFLGQPLSADFIASVDTEVFVLDQQMLSLLYVKDPSLEGRFYRYIATQLQQTLNKISN